MRWVFKKKINFLKIINLTKKAIKHIEDNEGRVRESTCEAYEFPT